MKTFQPCIDGLQKSVSHIIQGILEKDDKQLLDHFNKLRVIALTPTTGFSYWEDWNQIY